MSKEEISKLIKDNVKEFFIENPTCSMLEDIPGSFIKNVKSGNRGMTESLIKRGVLCVNSLMFGDKLYHIIVWDSNPCQWILQPPNSKMFFTYQNLFDLFKMVLLLKA